MRGERRLLELQEVDSAIDRLDARRAELRSGAGAQVARTAAERAETRVGELRLALDAVGRDQRTLERDIEAFGQKRAAEETRMYDGSIVNQKELAALQHEIESIGQRRSSMEDELLERMERFEALEAEVAIAEGELASARASLERIGGEAESELQAIDAELESRRREREAIRSEIDDPLLALYEELRRTKRGVAAAALVDGSCQGCHQAISAVELNKLKHSDGIKRCEHCRRILVFA
jgi:uncharacterized protein